MIVDAISILVVRAVFRFEVITMYKGLIFSLFDGSGKAVKDWADNGYKCICFNADGGDHGDYQSVRIQHENIEYVNVWIDERFYHRARLEEWGIPDFIMAFPPCTDLANSGSRHWAKKRLENPSFQDEAADTCRIAADIADYFGVPYMIENPVGKLSTLWRKPDYTFHPCDYAGYLPEDDKHPDFPDIIPARDRYFKKTCLWTGNGFVIPPRALILPKEEDKDNPGWAKTGGKSSRTKMIRSLTPRGFARAVFESNSK